MNEIYKTLAEGYEKLAAGYRALAKDQKDEKVEMAVPAEPEKKEVSIEEVRAALAAKTQAGKRREVKELLLKYDSGKLSGVKPENYAALMADAEALCFGTADMVIVTDKLVHIIDLKLGKGVPVYAEKNPQLMIYGLGILDMAEMLFPIETVRLTIFQPRLSNSSTWEIAPEDLKAWGDEVLRPAGELALKGEGDLNAGNWCRFCKVRFICRQRAKENLKLAQMEFKEPALLTDNEISEVLKQADELSKWAADVYAYAQDQAIVHHKQWNGFKLVMGKSNRKYTSEEEVAAAAKAAGYTDIYKHTLLGITDMERLMGKKEFARILGALVYKPAGKITLVPESDKREAIQTSTAEADFQKED